jgi:uncharacterized membrane protein
VIDKVENKFKLYDIYLIIVGVITALPVLAPILLRLGEFNQLFLWIGRVIYFIYSFTCHQFDHRSLFLFDYQYAWCARDTGIWLGILVAALYMRRKDAQSLPWYWFLVFMVPMAMDGGIQTVATMLGLTTLNGSTAEILYISNNFTRFLTGAIFGLGLSLVFSGYLSDKVKNVNFSLNHRKFWPHFTVLVTLVVLVLYPLLVQAWNVTSPKHGPSDALDSIVKLPPDKLFIRRQYGACPTLVTGLLSFNCDSA